MDGRIKTKTQTATTLIGGVLSNFSYNNHYTYYDNQPHTLKDVIDPANYQHFEWDANGNLTFHVHELNGTQRKLCWDEENRLMAVGDNDYTSYYVYDNGGERTYKLTGPNTLMNINGSWINFAQMNNPTLYTSAYLVAGVQGYTKHYYAGSERVSSAIGLGGLENINDPLSIEFGGSWDEKSGSLMEEMNRTIVECLKNDYNIATSLQFLHGMTTPTAGTMDRYFYHPDHLGSSSWITDGKGYAIQHLHYLPFGEDWVDQRNASWSAPYTFSGKEKDVETGYSYFGARYYDSGLNIWLSVDPMSDKYPNLTPYAYCANNPVILVDPDGRANSKDPPWKQINSVIPKEKFVGFRRGVQCFDLAKEQLNVVGYTCGSYYESTTHRVYTEQKGVNKTETAKAIQYIHDALEQGIPVLAGVDNSPGHPGNHDETTDHFIVIVGQGSDENRNYFTFYDNATSNTESGTSENNKLYYDSKDGKITGTSETVYSINSQRDYTITHVRESKALKPKENE